MTFKEALKALRKEKGLSEAKLATVSGVAFAALHTYAIGARTPSFPAVVKIARALGVSLDVFANCTFSQGDEGKPSRTTARTRKPTAKPKGKRP